MKLLLVALILFFSVALKAQLINVLHYRHEIKLNDKNDTLYGETYIKAVFKDLAGPVVLDLAGTNEKGRGMEVYEATAIARTVFHSEIKDFKDFLFENDKISIPILNVYRKDTVRIQIKYKGIPSDGLIISKNKFGDRTFFADNWPNRAHHWIPCIDKPDDKASVEFIVTAPSNYSVISNGIKVEEKETGNGMKLTHWKEDIPSPTKVMVIGVAKFATKTYDDSPKDIPVSAWFFPQDSTKAFYDYAVTPSILKFFADFIGPFPYKKLANVQSKTQFGGMENASCIFYNEDYVTGRRQHEDVMAHEIAHQWFGDMVSEKSFAHLWLSEGFADYFEHYYFEKKYGEEAARKKWEQARQEVIAFASYSSKAVVDSTEDLMSLLNANSYKKGAWFLRMLRFEVGDSIFQNIIRSFYNQYKGSNAETRDFEAVAEKVSGKELTWFFDQWLYQPGLPKLEIQWHYDSRKKATVFKYITPGGGNFSLTIPLVMKFDNAPAEFFPTGLEVRAIAWQTTIELETRRKPASIILDPYMTTLFEAKLVEIKSR